MSEQRNSWVIEKLTRTNREIWFRLMKARFQSKGVSYILQSILEEYAKVTEPLNITDRSNEEVEVITDSIKNINLNASNTSPNNRRIILNIEKKQEYLKDEGTMKYLLLQGLDDDDQALFDEYEAPMALWNYLVSKYKKPSKLAASQYTRELNNFEFTGDLTINDAWNKLKDLRRKIIAAKPTSKGQYDDESLMLILTNSLPNQFQSVIDDLNINSNLSIDDQLKHLESKEERLALKKEPNEPALISRNLLKPKKLQSKNYSESNPVECFLCDDHHYVVDCKYLAHCRDVVSDIKKKKRKSAHQYKFHKNKPNRPYQKSPKNKIKHGLVGAENTDDDNSENDTSSSGEESSDISEQEIAALTSEKRNTNRKIPVQWPIDTGASSHMTDDVNLFGGPLQK